MAHFEVAHSREEPNERMRQVKILFSLKTKPTYYTMRGLVDFINKLLKNTRK